jgi:hypothetical protein
VKGIFLCFGLVLAVLPARGAILHVRANASGPETNGLSWATAFPTIAQALTSASSGDELWVAGGTYQQAAIEIPVGVALYGGFAGVETNRTERDWARNRSVIDWLESDFYPPEYWRVQSAVTLTGGSRLDGFTVLNGRHSYGAGIYASEPGATIANNIIVTNHSAGIFGSALLVDRKGEFNADDGFFLKTANDLLRLQFPFGVTNIPVGAYSPTVHRLLQVAANLYDAVRSNTFPSVFRPQFASTSQGVIISGYYQDDSAATVNAWLSTNPYGIPMIIGARKGFPNFNELALQTTVLAARKLELRRLNTNSPPYQTNEMYIVGISNFVAVEAWNSHTQTFGHDLQIAVASRFRTTLRSGDTTAGWAESLTSVLSNFPAGSWSGFTFPPFAGSSFKVPLVADQVAITNSAFRFNPPSLEVLDAPFEANSGFRIPNWQLSLSNQLAFVLIFGEKIVDFVLLHNLTNTLNLTDVFFKTVSSVGEGAIANCWGTNRPYGTLSTPTEGVQAQMDISLGQISIAPSQWAQFNLQGTQDRDSAVASFMQFVFPSFGGGNTNLIQVAAFNPARKLLLSANWEANDPLIHSLPEHLKDSTNNFAVTLVRPFAAELNTNHSLGRLNSRYAPWGGRPGAVPRPQDISIAIKDSGVWSANDFDFPSGDGVNVHWLDRVHRGTPWQTLYFDAQMAPANNWRQQFLDPMSHPTNDWKIIKYLRGELDYSASQSATRVLNNTIVGNEGSGLWVVGSAAATVMNNVMAFNTSGLVAQGGELNRNCTFGNGTGNTGDVTGSPQFVPGDFALLATSGLIDAGDNAALGWIERNLFGARVDIGALEFGPEGVPLFTFSRTSESRYEFQLRGFPGQGYVIEATTNLVDWTAITTNVAAMGTLILQDAAGTNYSHRFYRAKVANHPN